MQILCNLFLNDLYFNLHCWLTNLSTYLLVLRRTSREGQMRTRIKLVGLKVNPSLIHNVGYGFRKEEIIAFDSSDEGSL